MSMLLTIASTCTGNAGTGLISSSCLPQTTATPDTLTTIFNIVFITIGSLSFLVMVIAGARYVFSKGEPDNIQKAKNEIKYALTGVVIAAMGAAMVNYVLVNVL